MRRNVAHTSLKNFFPFPILWDALRRTGSGERGRGMGSLELVSSILENAIRYL